MSKRGILFLVTAAVVLPGCTSSEDKARIRLAVSAWERAELAEIAEDGNEALMVDLDKSIDVVPDGHARSELLRCQSVLLGYQVAQSKENRSFSENVLKLEHEQHEPSQKDFDNAMAKAKRDSPELDVTALAECRIR